MRIGPVAQTPGSLPLGFVSFLAPTSSLGRPNDSTRYLVRARRRSTVPSLTVSPRPRGFASFFRSYAGHPPVPPLCIVITSAPHIFLLTPCNINARSTSRSTSTSSEIALHWVRLGCCMFLQDRSGPSLGPDEQPPPLLTSRAPLKFRVPPSHDVVIVLLKINQTKN